MPSCPRLPLSFKACLVHLDASKRLLFMLRSAFHSKRLSFALCTLMLRSAFHSRFALIGSCDLVSCHAFMTLSWAHAMFVTCARISDRQDPANRQDPHAMLTQPTDKTLMQCLQYAPASATDKTQPTDLGLAVIRDARCMLARITAEYWSKKAPTFRCCCLHLQSAATASSKSCSAWVSVCGGKSRA